MGMSNNMAYACYTCHPFTSSLLVANSSIQVSYFNWLLISFQHEHGILFFKGEDAIMRNTCKRLSCTSKIEMLEYSRVIYAWLTEFLLQLDHNSDSLTMQCQKWSGPTCMNTRHGLQIKRQTVHNKAMHSHPSNHMWQPPPPSYTPGPLSDNHFKKR